MALALSVMGMAHRPITGYKLIMAACYRQAAECAGWLGDATLTAFSWTRTRGWNVRSRRAPHTKTVVSMATLQGRGSGWAGRDRLEQCADHGATRHAESEPDELPRAS